MKTPAVIFVLAAIVPLACGAGEEAKPAPPALAGPPRPAVVRQTSGAWLGCCMTRPDPILSSQIPDLPPGMGLVVRTLSDNGPAVESKLELNDVLWKFEDQLLVNEGQLAVLLNHKHPGDVVRLTVFRAGKTMEIPLKLGTAPAGADDRSWFPGRGAPGEVVIVEPGTMVASVNTPQGRTMMKREGDSYRVTLVDKEGNAAFEKVYASEGRWEGLPDGQHRVVWLLRRSLDHRAGNGLMPLRPPRPRVVPGADPAPVPAGPTAGN